MGEGTRRVLTEPLVCDFCHREFRGEKRLISHRCLKRERFNQRSNPTTVLALQCYQSFWQQYKRSVSADWDKFESNKMYNDFVSFAAYCQVNNCVNIRDYQFWLIKNNFAIKAWTQDATYEKFLKQWVKNEDPWESIRRSLTTMQKITAERDFELMSFFKLVNNSLICQLITQGRITPWVIYNCDSGKTWLEKINEDQLKLIYGWIDPEIWMHRFHKFLETNDIQRTLKELKL